MNPLAVFSLFCFLVAACLFAYWLYDLRQLRRGLREDTQLDHWPIRGDSRFSRRNPPNWIHKP